MEFTLAEIAEFTNSTLVGDPGYKITGCADLESASEKDLSFLSLPRFLNTRYVTAMKKSLAGVILIKGDVPRELRKNYLINEDPSAAFQSVVEKMLGGQNLHSHFFGIHKTAIIHETVQLGDNVEIGPFAVIDANTHIGSNTFIGANAYIGACCKLGVECVIHANVTVKERCALGNCVVIHSGTVIGSSGFGYSTDASGRHTKIKQLGTVVIEDDVEIGANCVVDRGRFSKTLIKKGSKLDSSVIIGHNVVVGEHNLICGQTGIAGSTKLGDYIVVGGQCGFAGHLKIGDHVQIAGKSGISKSLSSGKYGGIPAQPLGKYNKNQVYLRQIDTYLEKIKDIEKRLDKIMRLLDKR